MSWRLDVEGGALDHQRQCEVAEPVAAAHRGVAVSSTSAQPAREIRPSAAMLFRAAAAQSDGSW